MMIILWSLPSDRGLDRAMTLPPYWSITVGAASR